MRYVKRVGLDEGKEHLGSDTVAVVELLDRVRRKKDTLDEFISQDMGAFVEHWDGLETWKQGNRYGLRESLVETIQHRIARATRVEPRVKLEKKRVGRSLRQIRVMEIDECGLDKCRCTGNYEHLIFPFDSVIEEMKEEMKKIHDATTAEAAHEARWVIDGLNTLHANHHIATLQDRLWREVNPPEVITVPVEEVPRYLAWNGNWKLKGYIGMGQAELAFDTFFLYQRALELESERYARLEWKPDWHKPPAGWQPSAEDLGVEE